MSQLTQDGTLDSVLADALNAEARLLSELTAVMRDQRDAIARDDLDALDDAVFATHRVLLTLGAARRQRQTVTGFLGDGEDLSLESLRASFDGAPPAIVGAAIASVSHAARTLHREVDVNRRVLRHVIDSGDQLLRSLAGASDTPVAYSPATPSLPAASRALLDRTV